MNLRKVNTDKEWPLLDYRFLFDDTGKPVGFGSIARPEGQYSDLEWERKMDHITDALWDRYGELYRDEETGELYGVESWFATNQDAGFTPFVWSRVERIAE